MTILLTRCITGILLLVSALGASAQGYPAKPIRLISSFAAGSTVDIVARAIAKPMSEDLGQPVVVENRGGAGGNLAMDAVAKSPKDGYTIGIGTSGALAINPALMKSMPYDALKDLAPISLVANVPNILVAGPSLQARTVADVIDYARKHPNEVNFASSGVGSVNHLAGELFQSRAQVQLVHLPYKGNQESLADLLAGRVQLMFTGVPPIMGLLQSGQLRALAVAGKQRMAMLPDLPTMAESGLPHAEASAMFSLVAPAGTPKAVVDRLQQSVARALAVPEVKARLTALGADPVSSTPDQLGKLMREDLDLWRGVIKALNIKMD